MALASQGINTWKGGGREHQGSNGLRTQEQYTGKRPIGNARVDRQGHKPVGRQGQENSLEHEHIRIKGIGKPSRQMRGGQNWENLT